MTPAFLLLVTVFAIWPDFVSPCGPKPEGPKEPKKDCYCGLANRGPTAKIVGGKETGVNEYPWQVFIDVMSMMCGGSLISDQWVLTAAHCVDNGIKPSDVKLVLGEHNISVENEADSIQMVVTEIIIHEKWDINTTRYDFALLRLRRKINFRSYPHIRPICLPDDGSKDAYNGYTATATGWGTTSRDGDISRVLLEVDVTVMNNSECGQYWWKISDFSQILCAKGHGGKGHCGGDSGGPLVTKERGHRGTVPGENYVLIGVTSFSEPFTCVDHPQGYARVTAQMKWIREKTKGSWRTCPRT